MIQETAIVRHNRREKLSQREFQQYLAEWRLAPNSKELAEAVEKTGKF